MERRRAFTITTLAGLATVTAASSTRADDDASWRQALAKGRMGGPSPGATVSHGYGARNVTLPRVTIEDIRLPRNAPLASLAVRRVTLRHLAQLAYCYERSVATDPRLAGRAVFRYTIGPDGTVTASGVERNLSAPAVGDCVVQAIRRWQFPSPGGGASVDVRLSVRFAMR